MKDKNFPNIAQAQLLSVCWPCAFATDVNVHFLVHGPSTCLLEK